MPRVSHVAPLLLHQPKIPLIRGGHTSPGQLLRSVRALLARFAVHAGFDAEPAEARRQIEAVRRLNETNHSPMIEAQLLSASADVARREGDLELALDLSRASVEAAAGCETSG